MNCISDRVPESQVNGEARDGSRGSIFRIERLAVYDGPGIRTVVFLKGCPLRCVWCSSPESQQAHPEMVYHTHRCVGCGECIAACPAGAIARAGDRAMQTDRRRCDHCGQCADACRYNARDMCGRSVSLAQVVREIEKDEVFYYRSGGGVTLSGGEPMAQPHFASAVLSACAERGIHTAMETCAFARWPVLSALLPRLDLIYIDIKHMDSSIHKRLTGVGNEAILDNVRRVAQARSGPELIIRIPLIPSLNDSEDNLRATVDFAGQLGAVQQMELLPYHRYGLQSYAALGKAYDLQWLPTPSDEKMRSLADRLEESGLTVQIGG